MTKNEMEINDLRETIKIDEDGQSSSYFDEEQKSISTNEI